MTITSSARYILINLMSFTGSKWINVKNVMATASRKTVIIQERIKMKRKHVGKKYYNAIVKKEQKQLEAIRRLISRMRS